MSILQDVKKTLGHPDADTSFDSDIILHINSVLSDLHQLGVGPVDGFSITGEAETWADFLADDKRLNNVKSYVYLRVKMLFDPPNVGYVLTSLEKLIERAEWRIYIAQDEITYPPAVIVSDPVVDGGTV